MMKKSIFSEHKKKVALLALPFLIFFWVSSPSCLGTSKHESASRATLLIYKMHLGAPKAY